MVRFDDDVAQKLRERAHAERRSLNRVVNDVMRRYLEAADGVGADLNGAERIALAANVRQRTEAFHDLLKPLTRQEPQRDLIERMLAALEAAGDCFTAIHLALSPESIPTIHESHRDEVHA
jgi:Arc/MetJ family transcription regulator